MIQLPLAILLSSIIGTGGILGSGLISSADESAEEKKRKQYLAQIQALLKPKNDPYLNSMNQAAMQTILQNMSRYGNFGWPEGMGMDTSFLGEALANAMNPTVSKTSSIRSTSGMLG